MHHLTRAWVALAAPLFAAISACRAGVALDSFGPSDTYSVNDSIFLGGSQGFVAFEFTPDITTLINRVVTPIDAGTFPGVTMSIVNDQSDSPGSTNVWTSTNLVIQNSGIQVFSGGLVTLNAGQKYWLVCTPSGSVGWHTTRGNLDSMFARKQGSTWAVFGPSPLPVVRIESTPPTGACCNTATGGCALTDSHVCGLLGAQFGGASTTCATAPCHAACRADFDLSGTLTVTDIFEYLNAWFAGCP